MSDRDAYDRDTYFEITRGRETFWVVREGRHWRDVILAFCCGLVIGWVIVNG